MKIKSFLLFLLLSVNVSPLLAQDSRSDSKMTCEDKVINGKIIKRCFYNNKSIDLKPSNNINLTTPQPKPQADHQLLMQTPLSNNIIKKTFSPLGSIEVYPFVLNQNTNELIISVFEDKEVSNSRYVGWISSTPNGPPLKDIITKWQHPGGSIKIYLYPGPWWNTLNLPPGQYYFNLKIEVDAKTHYVSLNSK